MYVCTYTHVGTHVPLSCHTWMEARGQLSEVSFLFHLWVWELNAVCSQS